MVGVTTTTVILITTTTETGIADREGKVAAVVVETETGEREDSGATKSPANSRIGIIRVDRWVAEAVGVIVVIGTLGDRPTGVPGMVLEIEIVIANSRSME